MPMHASSSADHANPAIRVIWNRRSATDVDTTSSIVRTLLMTASGSMLQTAARNAAVIARGAFDVRNTTLIVPCTLCQYGTYAISTGSELILVRTSFTTPMTSVS